MSASPSLPAGRAFLLATCGALVFQVFHLAEHTAQMLQWMRFPQRGPWMSPWATWLALSLGRIEGGRASEMTTQMQRGMELLHLLGNTIFLGGVVGLYRLTRSMPGVRPWSRSACVVQGLHLAEHVVLTATLYGGGTAIGLSTGFGSFDGTRLSTYRVWWHGLINLVATAVCLVVVVLWRRLHTGVPMRLAFTPRLAVGAPVMGALTIPLVISFLIGTPVAATAQPVRHVGAAPVDGARSGNLEAETFRLVDVAQDVGLDVQHSAFRWDVTMDPVAMMGGGVCWIDVDRDGWLDLFVTDTWSNGEWGLWDATGSLPRTRLFRNVGGVFEDYSVEWNGGYETRANGCVSADFNGDGFADLYVTTSRENLLLWNLAGTGFENGAKEAGADAYGWHTAAAAGDLNGDGWVDLVVSGYANLDQRRPEASSGFPNTFEPVADLVLINDGVGVGIDHGHGDVEATFPTFSSVGADVGLEPHGLEYGLGLALTDIDSDGDLDLYVANDTQPNRLYINNRRADVSLTDSAGQPGFTPTFTFAEVGGSVGVANSDSGMGVAIGDLNGDDAIDLVITNLEGQGHAGLLGSTSPTGSFEPGLDAFHELGWARTGWGVAAGDLDLDGTLDLVVASGAIPIEDLQQASEPLSVLLGSVVGPMVDASAATGLDQSANRNGRSVTFVDYDNDGDLDVGVTAIGQPLSLFQNRGAQGHWLMVDPGSPEPGLTARIELADGTIIERAAAAGSSWLSSEDPRIHLGIGTATLIKQVVVTRSDGSVEVFGDVQVDHVLVLEPR